ncbi:M56 family metallopeptidase [Amycolatopsis vastitatis]|uniref:Peptidase n=1 Tax=Amycolatopsis vastitatis TaxID=1905142 RepID=A0A229TE78_9PSEU|nr:M56 family metallopeptidase [Amycolatopsis vastitatis]OXM69547.1 peptidase [Amycolatopsis vastitatis]
MIYALHHGIALVVALGVAWYLLGAPWTRRRPRLAVVLWQVTALTIVVSFGGGLLALGLAPYRQGIVPGMRSFVADPGNLPQVLAVAAGLAVGGWLLVHQVRSSVRVARQRARHRDLLALVARGDRVLELDHPAVVAYCLPGRDPRVVVSAGTRRLLSRDELDAVLAHEQAHLRERHHLVLSPFTALAQLFPRWRALGRVTAAVGLLTEMCADDYAARRHGSQPLIGALEKFRLCGGGDAPAGTMAAGGTPLPDRIDRLRDRPATARRLAAVLAVVAAGTLLATPLSLFVVPF